MAAHRQCRIDHLGKVRYQPKFVGHAPATPSRASISDTSILYHSPKAAGPAPLRRRLTLMRLPFNTSVLVFNLILRASIGAIAEFW
jgi:hypothetical protein